MEIKKWDVNCTSCYFAAEQDGECIQHETGPCKGGLSPTKHGGGYWHYANAEQIKGLRIDSQTLVRDFITESDVIRADTVAHIRGVRFTRYTFLDSGIVEAEAAVGLSQVITYLKTLNTRDIKGDKVKAVDYHTMRQVNKKTIITAAGQGAIKGR